MNTANTPYTFGMATGEIISLLLLSFVIGILLCRFLRQRGICCRPKKKTVPLGIPPMHAGKYRTRDLDIHTANLPTNDVYVPKVTAKPVLTLPDVTPKLALQPPEIPPEATVEIPPEPIVEEPIMQHSELPPLPEIDPLLATIDPHKPILDREELDAIELHQPIIDPHKPIIDPPDELTTMKTDPLLDAIDPHKPIIDMPDMPDMPEISIQTDPLLAAIDPHKPIIDIPDTFDMPVTNMKTDPLLDAIDPHKPIIDMPDTPDMPETTNVQSSKDATLNILNDWLHKAKDSVEHLTEKATPAANEWLHKAKDSVEHLKEKAAPVSSDWLHKAKEFGNGLNAKGGSLGSETLVKGSSTLTSLAASAKELTEKLASNLSMKHDDLQKLSGIGPTFASVLHRAGIHTYQQLAETSVQKLQALLIVEDEQFSKHDTSSWPKQAALAAQGEWEQLKAYQESL